MRRARKNTKAGWAPARAALALLRAASPDRSGTHPANGIGLGAGFVPTLLMLMMIMSCGVADVNDREVSGTNFAAAMRAAAMEWSSYPTSVGMVVDRSVAGVAGRSVRAREPSVSCLGEPEGSRGAWGACQ
jgi:hypothetical protein